MEKKYWIITTIVIFLVIYFTGSIVLGIITAGLILAGKHYWVAYEFTLVTLPGKLILEWTEDGRRERKVFHI